MTRLFGRGRDASNAAPAAAQARTGAREAAYYRVEQPLSLAPPGTRQKEGCLSRLA